VLADIVSWVTDNETLLSGAAAVVVVLSIVGAAMRGALKKTSSALFENARSTKEVLTRTQVPSVDVSQPVPGFGGRPAIAVLPFDNMSGDPDQDYFADGITAKIVGAIAPKIESADIRRLQSKPTENMDAWDCVLRAQPLLHESSIESLRAAHEVLDKAISLDPLFAQAYAQLSTAWVADFVCYGGTAIGTGPENCLDQAEESAAKAQSLDQFIPTAHAQLAACYIFCQQTDLTLAEAEEAVPLNLSDLLVRATYSQTLMVTGKFDEAIEQLALGKRLSPGDAGIGRLLSTEAITLFAMAATVTPKSARGKRSDAQY
jgi:hypothetical protein